MYVRDVLGILSPKSHTWFLFLQSAVVVAFFIDFLSDSPAAKEPIQSRKDVDFFSFTSYEAVHKKILIFLDLS